MSQKWECVRTEHVIRTVACLRPQAQCKTGGCNVASYDLVSQQATGRKCDIGAQGCRMVLAHYMPECCGACNSLQPLLDVEIASSATACIGRHTDLRITEGYKMSGALGVERALMWGVGGPQ